MGWNDYSEEELKEWADMLARLKAADHLNVSVSKEPNEESILKIINLVKETEKIAGRCKKGENLEKSIERWYTWMHCHKLARLILKTYNTSKDMFLVTMHSAVPLVFGRTPTTHYVIEFDGYYYDINGKHTLEGLQKYCREEFGWSGMKISERKQIGPEEDRKFEDDVVLDSCFKRITIAEPEQKYINKKRQVLNVKTVDNIKE